MTVRFKSCPDDIRFGGIPEVLNEICVPFVIVIFLILLMSSLPYLEYATRILIAQGVYLYAKERSIVFVKDTYTPWFRRNEVNYVPRVKISTATF